MDVAIRKVPAATVYPIRHLILRHNQRFEDCVFPGDDSNATTHFGAYDGDDLVGIASVYCEPLPARREAAGWRIRGMATLETHRGRGIGSLLLDACIAHATSHGGELMWCNARTPAVSFYARRGFVTVDEEFDIPGIGPHFLMTKDIKEV